MALARPQLDPWRWAALVVLFGGIAAALWQDASLLDRGALRWSLAGVFAALWYVPVLRRDRRRAAQADDRVVKGGEPTANARIVVDGVAGLATGWVLGALYLSIPGSAHWLTQGPEAVDWIFDRMGGFGALVVIAVALVVITALHLAFGLIMAGARASKFFAALIVGLWLWLPFYGGFQTALAQVGITLPGLAATEAGAS